MRTWMALVAACVLTGLLVTPSLGEANVRIVRDVTYASRPGGDLALDAYLPRGPGPHPAVLIIPGGKWMFIDKAKNDWLPKQIAEQGIAAFAIEYRPSTTAPFPAALEDAQAAVRFVRAHAARFHIDPQRLGAVGGSSGGHLAALLATWGEGSTTTGDRVPVAISWSGPMNLVSLLHSSDGELVSVVETFLGCSATVASCDAKARLASPITHVDPSDGAVYVANSEDEIIPASQARQMAAALARSDVPHELTIFNAGGHGLNAAASYKGFDPAFAFLTQWIEPSAATDPTTPSPSPEKPGASSPSGAPATERKPVTTAGDRGIGRDWLPAIAIAALVLATIALLCTVVLLNRARRLTSGVPAPGPSDPSEDGSDRLVSSRTDDTR